MLDPKANVGHQGSIILWNRTLNLIKPQQTKSSFLEFSFFMKHKLITKRITKIKQYSVVTLISLNGIKRLFSSFESNPRMRAAWRKFRFVAARAFMIFVWKQIVPKMDQTGQYQETRKKLVWSNFIQATQISKLLNTYIYIVICKDVERKN